METNTPMGFSVRPNTKNRKQNPEITGFIYNLKNQLLFKKTNTHPLHPHHHHPPPSFSSKGGLTNSPPVKSSTPFSSGIRCASWYKRPREAGSGGVGRSAGRLWWVFSCGSWSFLLEPKKENSGRWEVMPFKNNLEAIKGFIQVKGKLSAIHL